MEDYINEINAITDYTEQLCAIPSPSGFTKYAETYLLNYFTELGYNPYQSNKGNVIVCLGGSGAPLTIAAHIDTLGAMVRSVKPNGKIRVAKVGGFPENTIERVNCQIHTRAGKTYTGTFQLNEPAIHTNKELGNTKRDNTNLELVLDEKVFTKEDVLKLGIETGDFISFDPNTIVTSSGFIKSRHLDDKASTAVLMALAQSIKTHELTLNRKVYLVFTTYEEVGHGGSSGIPVDTKEILSVDMGAMGDDLTTTEFQVSICAKDGLTPYDYDVTTRLIEVAKQNKLNFSVDVYPHYASDADMALAAGYDIQHGLIGPGVFASHGYERTHKEGLQNTFLLLKHYICD